MLDSRPVSSDQNTLADVPGGGSLHSTMILPFSVDKVISTGLIFGVQKREKIKARIVIIFRMEIICGFFLNTVSLFYYTFGSVEIISCFTVVPDQEISPF